MFKSRYSFVEGTTPRRSTLLKRKIKP